MFFQFDKVSSTLFLNNSSNTVKQGHRSGRVRGAIPWDMLEKGQIFNIKFIK
jgi:hypothetical protein